jgi:hypothetical protein
MDFVKVVGVVRSTTFVFKVLCTSIKKFIVFRVQTQSHRHVVGQCAALPRRRTRCAPRPHAGHLSVRARAPPESTRRPRPRLPHAPHPEAPRSLLGATCAVTRAVLARCMPRTASPSATPRRTRTGRGRHTTVLSPWSRRRHSSRPRRPIGLGTQLKPPNLSRVFCAKEGCICEV